MEINATEQNFKKEVLESEKPVLVDFWAEWCMPCRMIAPSITEIAKTYKDKLKVVKVNVDEAPDLAREYGISSIPTLGIFKNGDMVDYMVGALPKQAIEQIINQYL